MLVVYGFLAWYVIWAKRCVGVLISFRVLTNLLNPVNMVRKGVHPRPVSP